MQEPACPFPILDIDKGIQRRKPDPVRDKTARTLASKLQVESSQQKKLDHVRDQAAGTQSSKLQVKSVTLEDPQPLWYAMEDRAADPMCGELEVHVPVHHRQISKQIAVWPLTTPSPACSRATIQSDQDPPIDGSKGYVAPQPTMTNEATPTLQAELPLAVATAPPAVNPPSEQAPTPLELEP